MKNISKYVDFYVDTRHSTKSNKDYYPLILKINDVEIYVGYLRKDQYDDLTSLN